MPCDRKLRRNQTITERKTEIKRAVENISSGIAAGKYGVKISPKGAIAFTGIPELIRDDVTDACVYRQIANGGNALARMAIQRAEVLAGRTVDSQQVAVGAHSHDGGLSWHDHKG